MEIVKSYLTDLLYCLLIIGDKPYYYNAKTRESSWTRPENVKIIKQEEFEAIAASGQDPIMVISGVYPTPISVLILSLFVTSFIDVV